MTEQERVLAVYGSIAKISAQMVQAAKVGDWDQLVALEQDCYRLIERLKGPEPPVQQTDAQYVQRKASILRQVLADDAQVRKFTEPWMTRLEVYLGSARQATRLYRAYQDGPH